MGQMEREGAPGLAKTPNGFGLLDVVFPVLRKLALHRRGKKQTLKLKLSSRP